ncbi:MAG: type II secretion system protein [Planctomycetota bacterium]
MHVRPLRDRAGFTLIELLIVIFLIGILAVALLTNLSGAQDSAKIQECRALLSSLEHVAEQYQSEKQFSDYPPDDFIDRRVGTKLTVKADPVNAGIESFLIFVNRNESRRDGYTDANYFINTDNDRAQGTLGKLGTQEKYEVRDPWGNPIAYFHKRNYGKSQEYRPGEPGELGDRYVSAWKKRSDGSFFNPRTFQLFSAGPDGEYNTDDDVASFPIEVDPGN